jgi:hypothetical protein
MIRGAVVHLVNEQPLLVDLVALPGATDACLVCTNVRMTSGKKPAFIDHTDSWFAFPLGRVHFVEIPAGAVARAHDGGFALIVAGENEGEAGPAEDVEIPIDEDLLRRIRET